MKPAISFLVQDLLDEYYRNVCTHEETHRGGVIWTICSNCGTHWADDRGGFVPYKDPPAVVAAREFLAQLRRQIAPKKSVDDNKFITDYVDSFVN